MNKNNPNNSRINVYTASSTGQLKISTTDIKQTISATNNRAQYYADLAKKYRDEAKLHRDNAQYYAEQNSDVTFDYINGIRSSLEYQISLLQPAGDYALKEELPVNVSELENDSMYVNETQLDSAIDEIRLPDCNEHAGQILSNDGEKVIWTGINSFNLFDTKIVDRVLDGVSGIGWALAGTYVHKEALAGSYYGYPDFYAKCLEEYNEATNTEIINNVTIKVHSNGHKFYDIADKNAIDNYFNSIGSAWFYGIDTENERIFLPRNNYFEQMTSDTTEINKSISAGLPNITGYVGNFANTTLDTVITNANGAFSSYNSVTGRSHTGGENANHMELDFDASRSNSIYGKSNTVQPNAVKKLLYICVGNTTNYEGMTDVVNQGMDILEQVAQKVNLDGTNLNTEGKSLISSFGMPSSKYVNLTLGASGTTYTAPANGYFFVSKISGKTNGYLQITNNNARWITSIIFCNIATDWAMTWMPVKKGDLITITYDVTGQTNGFNFIYAQGEV